MSGFTPGPWEIMYAGQDDMTNAECVAEEMPVVSIGPIWYCEFSSGLDQDIQRKYADARLMAAAPDLYSALKRALFALAEASIHIPYGSTEYDECGEAYADINELLNRLEAS